MNDLLTRIEDLAGSDVANKICAEFGGNQVYIRRAIPTKPMVRCSGCIHHRAFKSMVTICTLTKGRIGLNNPRQCEKFSASKTTTSEPTMNRISLSRMRDLLRNHLYRTVAVTASIGGGWFVQRPH